MVLQSFLDRDQLVETILALDAKHAVLGLLMGIAALRCASWLRSKDLVSKGVTMPLVPSSTLPIIHNTLDFAMHTSDFHDWLLGLCEQFHGRTFVLRTLGRPDVVVLTTSESIEDVMKTHFENFLKGDHQYQVFGDMLGKGIFATDGMNWVHQRKVASNLFTARTLRESMTEVIRKHTVELRRILHDAGTQDKTIDLFNLLNRFTIDAFAEIGFGVSMKSMESEEEHPFQKAFDRVQRATMLRLVRPTWFWKLQKALQIGAERQLREDVRTIDRMVLDIIAQSMHHRHSHGKASDKVDLVSLFLDNYEKNPESNGEEFDPQYLRDIVVNFLIAGRDTTAQALGWFFKNVSMHPEVVAKIRTEIKDVLPQLLTGEIDTPTMEQVQQLTYLEAALKESLRLYSAVPVSSRVAVEDVVLSDGTLIRKGKLSGLFRDGLVAEALQNVDAKQAAVGVIATLTAIKCASWLLSKASEKRKMKRLGATSKPAAPSSTLPFALNTLDFAAHIEELYDWFMTLIEQHQGRPVVLRTLGRHDMVLISTPEGIEDVMKTHFESFPKGDFLHQIMGDLFGKGIFATDGLEWIHQRKVSSNLFTTRTLRDAATKAICKHTTVLRRILHDAGAQGQTVDIFKLFGRFTIETFAEIGFGIKMNAMEAEVEHPFQTAFDCVQRMTMLRFARPTWFWKLQRMLHVGAERELREAITTIDQTVLEIIAQSIQRRQANEKTDGAVDLVMLFLDHYENTPEGKNGQFDTRYMRDIVFSFLIASRDSTAQALSWFFKNISMHPEVAKKIRNEIAEMIPELMDGSIDTPTMEQVQRLTYLEACLKESLRLYPAVPLNAKLAVKDVVLSDGTVIFEGQTVGIPAYANSRMKYVWGPDAAVYNPDRWIDPETGKLTNFSAFKFFSFNAGPRTCLGMNLAMLEMKIVVASLLSRLEIQVLEPEKVTYKFSLTLPVKGEMHTRITPLHARAH
ncbi:hypothetical protein Poli38472_005323 [Pythium oligandrum]|uniref:Cytochrome P450 n=1 Tax=Pythium oligandrum TaxID=41045 RepID=A0A8K1CHA6_PYTOL|nr:hypothetical protein Poli38472_005323 [Pythium oligandrum]|eukprot:TMW62705.1 hypothetical protein Poli38472_005323 [Pythium oligandrum]